MFELTSMTDAEIDTIVDDMERADLALAVYVQRVWKGEDPVRELLETRAAILRWCSDPQVARCFNSECVRATAAAVHAMTLPEFSDYARALDQLARMQSARTRGVA
jgi:hypothetical protein